MALLADVGSEFGSLWTAIAGGVQSWLFWIGAACVLIWYVPQAVALVRSKTIKTDDVPGPDCVTKRMELIAEKEAEIVKQQGEIETLKQENIDMAKILTGGAA